MLRHLIRKIFNLKSTPLVEGVADSSVSGLGLVVAVEEKRVGVSPRVLVRDTPDSDTNTLRNIETRLGDSGKVGSTTVLNVELGDGNLLDVGTSENLESSRETRSRVPATRLGKMGLATNTVDGDTLSNPLVNVIDHTAGNLGVVGNVKVVVVDVELGVGVSGAGSAEGNSDHVLAEDLVDLAVAHASVLGEDLVDDVPVEDLALVAGDHGLDVILNDRGHGGAVLDVLDPLRELGVPNEGVATDLLAVGDGEIDDLVGVAKGELATRSWAS